MDKVVILARVSTQTQDYQRQVTELQEYCDRVGWEVRRVFANKVSGTKALTERSEIVDMVEYIFSNGVCNFLQYAVNKIGNCYRLVPLHIDKKYGLLCAKCCQNETK